MQPSPRSGVPSPSTRPISMAGTDLGLICLDRQQYNEAREAFEQALAVRPGDPRALDRKKYALLAARPAVKTP